MKEADDYLAYIKALIIANPQVAGWKALREEAQGDLGLFRYMVLCIGLHFMTAVSWRCLSVSRS